jgi:hypothetical protein
LSLICFFSISMRYFRCYQRLRSLRHTTSPNGHWPHYFVRIKTACLSHAVSVCFVNRCLEGLIALIRHDEISVNFAFRGSKIVRGVKQMALTMLQSDGIRCSSKARRALASS